LFIPDDGCSKIKVVDIADARNRRRSAARGEMMEKIREKLPTYNLRLRSFSFTNRLLRIHPAITRAETKANPIR
jgi:hypothetical protein